MTISKEIFGWISIAVAVISYIPYVWMVWRGQVRPHVFSWVLWALVNAIVTAAQITEHGGPGLWSTAFTGAMCVVFALMGLKHGRKDIRRIDWILFVLALLAIPLWRLTDNPAAAVVLVTFVNLVAFYMTAHKAWHAPQQESAFSFACNGLKFAIALLALERFNLATAFFPAIAAACGILLTVMIVWRRIAIKRNNPSHSVI